MNNEDILVKQLVGINFSLASLVAILAGEDKNIRDTFTESYVEIMAKYSEEGSE